MRKLFYTTIISLSVCIISLAQISEFKIVPTDGSADDWFGYSVSISGDFSIVGAIIDDDNGNMSGSAYIFKREGANWTEQQKLIASDGSLEDNFGGSVSISEDYAIVGAHADDDNGTESGSAYIFIKDGTDWIELQKIKPSDGAQEDNFGTSVSISGDYTIIGAPLNNNNGILTGSAYIFRRNDTNWIQEQKLIASDGETLDSFGAFVSISGNYAVVGAPFDNDKGFLSGSVYIFERDDTTWTEKQKLTASDGTADDYFGSPVSISENYLIVGAPLDDDNGLNSGSAYIFRKDLTTWIEEQKVISSDGDEDDNFGHSVSISDNYAIVSTYRKDNYTGSAYIFRKIDTTWIEEHILIASDGAEGDDFGTSVSISGDYLIIGAKGDSDNGAESGSAYIYSDLVVGIEDEKSEMPLFYNLNQNYPNPFNPSTSIQYAVSNRQFVNLKVFDVLGNEIATLVNEEKQAGNYKVEFNATGLPSGVYFYQLKTDGFVETKKMLLLK